MAVKKRKNTTKAKKQSRSSKSVRVATKKASRTVVKRAKKVIRAVMQGAMSGALQGALEAGGRETGLRPDAGMAAKNRTQGRDKSAKRQRPGLKRPQTR